MRKTTQSMYQSNLKVPVTASKVFDGSNLYKSSAAIPSTDSLTQTNQGKWKARIW